MNKFRKKFYCNLFWFVLLRRHQFAFLLYFFIKNFRGASPIFKLRLAFLHKLTFSTTDVLSPGYIRLKFNTFEATSDPITSQMRAFTQPITLPQKSIIFIARFFN